MISIILSQYQHVTDGQTDRQTDTTVSVLHSVQLDCANIMDVMVD